MEENLSGKSYTRNFPVQMVRARDSYPPRGGRQFDPAPVQWPSAKTGGFFVCLHVMWIQYRLVIHDTPWDCRDVENQKAQAKYNIKHLNFLAISLGCSPWEFLPEKLIKDVNWKLNMNIKTKNINSRTE